MIVTGVSFGSGHRTAGIFRGQGRPWGVCGVFSCDGGIFFEVCVKFGAEDCFEGNFVVQVIGEVGGGGEIVVKFIRQQAEINFFGGEEVKSFIVKEVGDVGR